MARLTKGIAALLFVLAVANAGQQTIHVYRMYHHLFLKEDSVSHADRVFGPAREELTKMGATRLGYRLAPGATFDQKAPEYYIVQYALAPIVVLGLKDEGPWILTNYSGASHRFPAPDLTCVEDFGWGLAVQKKTPGPPASVKPPDLGRIWHEREGEWTATWTRRGLTNIFDGVWKAGDGQEIKDEIVYESVDCQRVTLFRKGTNGRYRGRLSEDGTRIGNGQADWFSRDDRWSATIDRSP